MSKSKKHSGEHSDGGPSGKEDNSLRGRRKLIKGLAGGGSLMVTGAYLPEKWARPAVQSVLLPAHAATSPCDIVLECSLTVCEGTGEGQGPCITLTSSDTVTIGCDGNVDIGGNANGFGCDIVTRLTQCGDPIPGLLVQLDVSLDGVFPGGAGLFPPPQVQTDGNGIARCFEFGLGDDLFSIDDGDSAQFCFSVVNRPEIAPCCITVMWDCDS